jgi:hypothetical protein
MRKGLFQFIKTYQWDAIMAVLIVLELAFMLYFHKGTLSNDVNAVCFTLTSLLIGIVLIAKYYGRDVQYVSKPILPLRRKVLIWAPLILTVGLVAFFFDLVGIFKAAPIDPAGSDIIPTVQLAVQRLLHGEWVYAGIDKWGYQLPLTYLPMQWLPYTIAEWLQLDYRWITIAIFTLAAFMAVARSNRISPAHGIAVSLLLIYACNMLVQHDTGILSMTVELMVAGYYLAFVAGISGTNPWLRGAFIAICLLSRYSLVLWLPLWAVVEVMRGDRKDFFKSCGMIATLVLVIYIMPFLSRDWGAFARGYQYYSQAAIGEWERVNEHKVPHQLDHGLGFAKLFYLKLWEYSIPDRLKSLQKFHLIVCIGSTVVMGIWYWIVRQKIHPRIFLLASFKIYLTLFLAFIQVPYPYLMITTAAVSIAIFAELPRWRREDVG